MVWPVSVSSVGGVASLLVAVSISRRTQASTVQTKVGAAGDAGPGAMNGASTVATSAVIPVAGAGGASGVTVVSAATDDVRASADGTEIACVATGLGAAKPTTVFTMFTTAAATLLIGSAGAVVTCSGLGSLLGFAAGLASLPDLSASARGAVTSSPAPGTALAGFVGSPLMVALAPPDTPTVTGGAFPSPTVTVDADPAGGVVAPAGGAVPALGVREAAGSEPGVGASTPGFGVSDFGASVLDASAFDVVS